MTETWLSPNRRILAVSLAGSLILAGVALWILSFADAIPRWSGALLLALAAISGLVAIVRLFRRRVARQDGNLLIDLGPRSPIPVPIEAVECFFLGSLPTKMSGKWGLQSRAVSIVIRLAERDVEYHNRTVSPRLGTWSDGYITIRGSWCEPISPALVNRLNKQLIEAKGVSDSVGNEEKAC